MGVASQTYFSEVPHTHLHDVYYQLPPLMNVSSTRNAAERSEQLPAF